MSVKLHLYGGNSALTMEASQKKMQDGVFHTLNLDVAPKPGDRVDWDNKISLQLSPNELTLLAGVFLGYAPNAHFQRPGKGIKIERQPSKVYLSASAGKGRIYGLPLNIGDSQRAADLVVYQLVQSSYTKSVESVLAGIRGSCGLLRLG